MTHGKITHLSFHLYCLIGLGLYVAGYHSAAWLAFSIPLAYLLLPLLAGSYIRRLVRYISNG